MTKKNYSAWHINAQTFSDVWPDSKKLEFFARYAILAPSGHNTQPWHFNLSQQSLTLKNNPGRHLPYSGTKAAEPYISLGTCLETLRLAAKGFGYRIRINYVLHNNVIAVVTLAGKEIADPTLPLSIVHRSSNRNYYETENLPPEMLNGFTQTDLKNATTYLVSDREDIVFIANQTKLATIAIMSDSKFRLELSKWVRNNLTKQHDGMPGFVQGIPTPPSMIARHIIKRLNISKDQAKKDSNRVINSANLVIIMIKGQNEESFVDAGRVYAQICILAQNKGVASSGIGAAVINPETKQAIKTYFKLEYEPVAIIRLGKTSKQARHTPRWSLHQVMD